MDRRCSPQEEERRQLAADWAAKSFAAGPNVSAVFVRYDPWGAKRAGRRNKPSAAGAEQEAIAALQRGDVESARAAMEKVEHLPDPGLALCRDRESLTVVLEERLRRGEHCFVDGLLHERVATLTVWRE